ncbi:MAG TPA: acyltransferase [Baekduia sp.]|nr:acyltransferase [Baekduia sp.]
MRHEALDGLRGLAAFAVLVLHVWMFHHGDAGRPPRDLLDRAIGEMRLGVPLFFVLSGFLLYRPFAGAVLDGAPRPSLGRYALRRAARILPAYLATLAGAFVLLRLLDHPRQIALDQLPVFLLFAQNQFDATRAHLDPPMWSLCVEVSFYVLLPLLAVVAGRLGATRGRQLVVPAALGAIGAGCTAAAALWHWPATVTTSLLLHLLEFGAGMAVAVLLHQRPLRRATGLVLAAAGMALVLGDASWHGYQVGPQQPRLLLHDAPASLGFALLVAAVVGTSWRLTALSRGPARWLGTISYGVYLIHFPVILALRETGHWSSSLGLALLAVGGLSVALATASWLLLERPVVRWAHRATVRRRACQPVAEAELVPGRPIRPPRSRGRGMRPGDLHVLRPQPAAGPGPRA